MNIIATSIVPGFKTRFVHLSRAMLPVLGLMLTLAWAGCQTQNPGVNTVGESSALQPEATVLHEGDRLRISFPGASNLDTTQQVRTDGKIVLPVVGEMVVVGMTPAGLEKELVSRYSTQLLSKEVTVAVESSAFVVYVTGAVLRPGKILSNRPLTALEAVMEAGGFDYTRANQKSVKVIRHENGQTRSYTVNLKLEMQGKSGGTFPLKASDVVYVPESFTWF